MPAERTEGTIAVVPCPRITLRVASVVFAMLLASACQLPWARTAPADGQNRARLGLRTATVARGDITSLLVYPGELRPKAGAIVATRVAGRLDRLLVEPGASVREGDTLAELDRSALEVQVVQAQASLAAAEARLAGLKSGGDTDSRAEADASLRAAKARLATLEAAPKIEAIPALAQAAREARRRLSELEGGRTQAVAAAEARLDAARSQLDTALTSTTAAPPPAGESAPGATPSPAALTSPAVEQARQAVQVAQQEVARARQPVGSDELAAARQQLADAEDALLQARWPVSPGDLDEARANVEAAEARLRRAGQPSSEAAIKAGETAVEYAGAAVELARVQLREATLVSPISGIVVQTHQKQGDTVAPGTAIVTLQPPDYEIQVAIDERQLAQVATGQTVGVLVDVYPGESFTGTVRSISPSVEARTRTVAARVDVQDPRAKLKSGLFAQVAIAGGKRSGALIVPREAVVGTSDLAVMAVLDGRARRQAVQIGVQDGRSVEITQGVAEGTEVILTPTGILDGDVVGGEGK
ncbi:MAG: efflux RND transporter periplasmic adaptor subunit [Chloroflexi bacterium]|nr:efflux RND transporter periplasmic adaptor subunit [Chloroflexota bacterium]